ncbi:Metacaspase-1A [Dipodascopsis uninucleata]
MAYPGRGHYSYGGSNQHHHGGGYNESPPGPPPGQYGGPQYGGPPQGPPSGFYGVPPSGPPPGYGGPPAGPPHMSYDQRTYEPQSAYSQHNYNGNEYNPNGGGYGEQPYNGGYNNNGHQNQYSYGGSNDGFGTPDRTQLQGGGYNYPGNNTDSFHYSTPSHMQAPPTTMQSFGNGAPQGYGFQYSNCTGRRKALLIGINYIGQKAELKGCINDVKNVSRFLSERYGYKYEDMVILTDDQTNPRSIPTKQNMYRAMQWLVKDAQPHDSLFFHYSGHGGQTEDLNGDEEDGYDEVIYPVDFQVAGHIVDDELHEIMVRPLPAGVRLTAIFDSCHSGTVLDLPYIYSTQGVLKEPNLAKEAGMGLLSAFSSYTQGNLGGAISSVGGIIKSFTNRNSGATEMTRRTKTSPADVISLSGCKDSQTSADTQEAGQATGAMSYAFVSVLSQSNQQSYLSLLQNMRQIMAAKYTQKPQLSASHPIDTNLQFIM